MVEHEKETSNPGMKSITPMSEGEREQLKQNFIQYESCPDGHIAKKILRLLVTIELYAEAYNGILKNLQEAILMEEDDMDDAIMAILNKYVE